jgi:hypothetical protein
MGSDGILYQPLGKRIVAYGDYVEGNRSSSIEVKRGYEIPADLLPREWDKIMGLIGTTRLVIVRGTIPCLQPATSVITPNVLRDVPEGASLKSEDFEARTVAEAFDLSSRRRCDTILPPPPVSWVLTNGSATVRSRACYGRAQSWQKVGGDTECVIRIEATIGVPSMREDFITHGRWSTRGKVSHASTVSGPQELGT